MLGGHVTPETDQSKNDGDDGDPKSWHTEEDTLGAILELVREEREAKRD